MLSVMRIDSLPVVLPLLPMDQVPRDLTAHSFRPKECNIIVKILKQPLHCFSQQPTSSTSCIAFSRRIFARSLIRVLNDSYSSLNASLYCLSASFILLKKDPTQARGSISSCFASSKMNCITIDWCATCSIKARFCKRKLWPSTNTGHKKLLLSRWRIQRLHHTTENSSVSSTHKHYMIRNIREIECCNTMQLQC